MNISVQQLLGKIEDELKQAKASGSEARIRESIHAIKALCELALDEKPQAGQPVEKPVIPVLPKEQIIPAVQGQPRRLKMDDDANGESLFDF